MNRRAGDAVVGALVSIDLAAFLGIFLYIELVPTTGPSPEPFVGAAAVAFYLANAATAALGLTAIAVLFRGSRLSTWVVLAYVGWALLTSQALVLEPNDPEFIRTMQELEREAARSEVEPVSARIIRYPFEASFVVWATAALYVTLVRPRLPRDPV